jgi:serine protease AprX
LLIHIIVRNSARHFFSFLAVVLLVAPPAWAQDSDTAAATRKIDRSLRDALTHDGQKRHVIITVKPGFAGELRTALEAHGDVIASESPLIDALVAEIHSADIADLARQPWVETVSDDAVVYAGAERSGVRLRRIANRLKRLVESGAPALETSNIRETLGLPKYPTQAMPFAGTGIGVAIIDSGIAPNLDFGTRITAFYDFTRGGIATVPYDDYGHGTHIAGLIGSNGLMSGFQLAGVAPNVNLVGLKVLDKRGQGRTSDVIRAIEYVIVNSARLQVQVINLSLGHPIFAPAKDDPLVRAVEKASAAGLIVVTSAGNFGKNPVSGEVGSTGITSPGNAPSAITVGAANTQNTITRLDDTVAAYSSRGPSWFDGFAKPDVLAPGHHLASDSALSAFLFWKLWNSHKASKTGVGFLELSGTSMAAGVTTGAVAVLLEANRAMKYPGAKPLTANIVKALLEFTAIPVGGADYLAQGAGEINVIGAIALSMATDTSQPSSGWWLHALFNPQTNIDGVSYPWSQRVVYGNQVLTGSYLGFNLPVWSQHVVWGSLDADNIVWGTRASVADDNIVWGTKAVATWAPKIVWPDRVIGIMDGDNIVWGTSDADNIVWGTLDADNIVWGTRAGDNIIWGTSDGENIVWGTSDDDNIVWGTSDDDNIVWGTSDDDNIVWGTSDNIVWGTFAPLVPGNH